MEKGENIQKECKPQKEAAIKPWRIKTQQQQQQKSEESTIKIPFTFSHTPNPIISPALLSSKTTLRLSTLLGG